MLYVVATPIGNLGDMTSRAINVLSEVDVIASEDTRVTRRLLSHFEIENRCISYHDKNEIYRAEELVNSLIDENSVALVSDAGTPCISDPGYRIVNLAKQSGIEVVSVPGPSALTAALSISGLPTDHFFFEGFLPKKKGRQTRFKFLSELQASVVIYESPMRIIKTLKDISALLGEARIVSVCREITKKFEEVFMGTVEEAIGYFSQKNPKGEFVIVVAKEGYELK
ncbi:MAG: 16S rRNA (cytidine(1402)-2'-O)-methyltransferase [Candidatus Marinimicrobia bacterium]|nr:16S rRNA (cytidine(1402)-2'-O)-methyltransferase [Candidatus Neomarinimicrobiota bacterium]